MNQHLQDIATLIQQDEKLSAEQKAVISKSLKDADKELEITAFKLDRTEKVKRTTAILLEETIEELEQKRKAVESTNRELEIESSLERVRTVAMGMRNPDDMLQVCRIISEQLELLNVKEIRNVQTAIIYESKGTYLNYEYYAKHDKLLTTDVGFKNHRIQERFANQMLTGAEELFTENITGEELQKWLAYQKTTNQFADVYLKEATSLNYYWYSLGPVALGISTYAPLAEEEINLFKRFRNVFELAYKRFLDIQKAEAQAREAQIEAGLERVRSRSMAMHNTTELQEVIHTVHKELLLLNIAINGGSFIAINKEIDTTLRCWGSGGTADTSEEVQLPLYEKPFCTNLINSIKKGQGFFTEEYTQQEKKDFFTFLFKHEPWSKLDTKNKQETLSSTGGYTRSCYVSKHTSIFIINHYGEKFSASDNDILKRFAKVFEQTYTRFLDLQKAEAQAREAIIEAALERVRSRSMAMHKSDEVMDVAVTVYEQLQKLDFKFGAATIIIMDKNTGNMEHWLAGFIQKNHIESYQVKNIEHPLHAAQLKAWREGAKFVSMELAGPALESYAKEMFTQTGYKNLPEEEKEMLSAQEHTVFNLAYMSHGALMWAPSAISDENAIILQRFAKVFEQTYTRFLDLQKVEAQALRAEQDLIAIKEAKQKAEEALLELQAAQKQLIQSEKMASLGELTAGIAHEIQNPLNFVNNFSEVSRELLDEMKLELNNGNAEDAKEIANDVIQNLEKINHHGKRAADIVKGMLQHSRSSTGVKESTDINALCDEYLRLSYHGLRAKDKSFNATIKTDFDASLEKVNIIPQDIGRVVLNLLTNAFYAVNEKKKSGIENHEPTVSVSTKKIADKIEISVTDNGNGIPKNIVDKIFQPFFTTKPTGQGTGLGLSLSYDIVKSHGGELKVETKENEGTEFKIILPKTNTNNI